MTNTLLRAPESIEEGVYWQRGNDAHEPVGDYHPTESPTNPLRIAVEEDMGGWRRKHLVLMGGLMVNGMDARPAYYRALALLWPEYEDNRARIDKEARQRAGCVHP